MDRKATVITVAKAIVFSCVWIFASVEGFVESDSTCKGRADGVYGVDCSQWYLACVAGNTFRMQCPPNLYFNSKKVICDYQDKVPGCSARRIASDTRFGTVKCKEKQNSVLPVGVCKQEYLVCKDGVGKMSKCDSGLFYDANVKACSPITAKSPCNPIPMELAAFESSGLLGSICEGRFNEVVALPCSSKFFICVDRTPVSMECPNKSIYNIEINQCDHRSRVIGCSSTDLEPAPVKVDKVTKPTTTTTPATTTTAVAATTTTLTTRTTAPAVMHQVDPISSQVPAASDLVPANFCREKKDGDYEINECDTIFATCSNGIVYVRRCGDGLIFDGRTCDYRSHISACSKSDATSRKDSFSSPGFLQSVDVEQLCINEKVYATGPCSVNYVQCKNGRLLLQSCPVNTIFDVDEKRCLASSSRCNIKVLDDSVFDGIPFTCQYGELLERGRCASTFFECTDTGRYALVACPYELYFDPVVKSCKPKSQIIDCDDGVEPLKNNYIKTRVSLQQTGIEAVAVDPMSQDERVFDLFDVPPAATLLERPGPETGILNGNEQSVYVVPNVVYRAKREVEKGLMPKTVKITNSNDSICNYVRDGNYGLVGCRSDYVTCLRNTATFMHCPSGLVYNSEWQTCDYPEKVWACSGERMLGELPNTNLLDKSLLAAISKGITASASASLVVSQFKCVEDGFYGLGCSPTLIICSNSRPYVFTCPADLFFDEDKKQCVYRSAIPSCHLTPDRIQHTALQGNLRQKTFEFDADRSQMFVCSKMEDGIYGFMCTPFYIKCKGGKVIRMPCAEGLKYDLALSRCVPEKYCGKMDKLVLEAAERFQTRVAEQCKDRSIKIPLQISCRRQYYTCKGGSSHRSLCSKNEVFSLSKKKCVGYTSCTSSDDTDIFKSLPDFCSVRVDGMYKHPNNCSRIIQCYKGEGFEHFPCSSGLVFNEVSALCDYAINHPQCLEENPQERSDLCSDKAEGEFLGLGHCSRSYYRCSLGRPVSFQCPENTVYNHVWNVCDYRENVESCT